MKGLICISFLAFVLAGCSRFTIFADSEEPVEPTLADLQVVTITGTDNPLPDASLAEMADMYREVLTVTDDPANAPDRVSPS